MDIQELKNMLNNCELTDDKIIIKSDFAKMIEIIKQKYGFDVLKEIIAVDNKERGIELTYHMYSTVNEEDFLLATNIKDEAESVTGLFDSAYADEKEIYDMFGVKFIGNEELKRLYMPESWEGNPLKKDYEENDQRLKWNE